MELQATLPLHEHRCSFWTLIRVLKKAKFQVRLFVSFGHILVFPKSLGTCKSRDISDEFIELGLSILRF